MGGVEGAAWSLSGDAFTDWDTIQRTCNPGGYGPSAVRPSLCHGLSCLLPFPGQAPGGGGGVPAGRGKHGPWGAQGDGAGTHRAFTCAGGGGAQGLPWFAGCWDRLRSLVGRVAPDLEGGGRRGGGCGAAAQIPQQSGHLGAGVSLRPRRLPASL